MNESPDEPPLVNRIASGARTKTSTPCGSPFPADTSGRNRPISPAADKSVKNGTCDILHNPSPNGVQQRVQRSDGDNFADKKPTALPPPAPPPENVQDAEKDASAESKLNSSFFASTIHASKVAIRSSWINWLLFFVPIGLALGGLHRSMGDASPVSPTVVFAMNAVGIIPLAWLLGFATESVANNLGDTVGALLNVTFGNAVEIIIFVIALVAKEVRVVQASLLGSILANLLLILGMCFVFGGLRFREQLYNSAITQMSASLLSLSVMSLLLPTAFHASFSDLSTADAVVLKVSRGTSVILLLVYILYLLFQLKSHAYMYQSTPQHKIDEESHPGVLAEMLNSSSSSSESDSSDDDDDTVETSGSNRAKRRIKKVLGKRRRRTSSSSSKDVRSIPSMPSLVHPVPSASNACGTSSFTDLSGGGGACAVYSNEITGGGRMADADEAMDVPCAPSSLHPEKIVKINQTTEMRQKRHYKDPVQPGKKREHPDRTRNSVSHEGTNLPAEPTSTVTSQPSPHVPAVTGTVASPGISPRRQFNLHSLSSRPPVPRALNPVAFMHPHSRLPEGPAGSSSIPTLYQRGLRRTISLPDRLESSFTRSQLLLAQPLPHLRPSQGRDGAPVGEGKPPLSRSASIILLIISTGMVAACAEFLVDSIDYIVENTGVSQAFIGLIILPIVGNAAEHVTAVTVASKNKMDLAIGVALGSSIQIALFVTPIIVLLGWSLGTDMSLYFSLFETVALFASAFIVNYLVLDGRSNYLEGTLLIAAYVIIAVAAFFYPSCGNLSSASGPHDGKTC